MNKPKINIIVAHDSNRGIGKDNKLIWHIPEDLKRFKEITSGHPIVMGRKTFESIGRPLPNRTNIIITRDIKTFFSRHSREGGNPDPRLHEDDDKLVIVPSIEEALKKAKDAPGGEEIFIIGGGQIFKEALPLTERLYVTVVDGDFSADVFFPGYLEFKKVVSEEKKEGNGFKYTFLVLDR